MYLFFGANRSGEFFGYAKMIEPIDKEKAALHLSSKSASHGSSSGSGSGPGLGPSKQKAQSQPQRIKEEEEDRGHAGWDHFLSPSVPHMTSSSPGELSPREEVGDPEVSRGERKTDPARMRAVDQRSAPAAPRAQTHDPKAGQPSYFPPVPIAAVAGFEQEADRQQALGGSTRSQEMGDDGVLRKDTALTPAEKEAKETAHGDADEEQEFGPDSWGQAFNIQWIRVGSLSFNRTRHLRNPWNVDREVKVSRDGTEVEPSEWFGRKWPLLRSQWSACNSCRSGTNPRGCPCARRLDRRVHLLHRHLTNTVTPRSTDKYNLYLPSLVDIPLSLGPWSKLCLL